MPKKNIIRVATIVGLILLMHLLATLVVTVMKKWTIGEFLFTFVWMFCAGLSIDFVARKITNPVYRSLAILTIVIAFIFIASEIM